MILLAAAIAATVADGLAFLFLVAPGAVKEENPLWYGAPVELALAAEGLLVVLLIALPAVVRKSDRNLDLRMSTVRLALIVAVAAGVLGVVSTVGAAG